jgi:hypothetical protein
MSHPIAGKVVLITGPARDIGAETARQLAVPKLERETQSLGRAFGATSVGYGKASRAG